jgi:hypothetical protein
MEVLEKHKRYGEHHVPGEVFWGLGIENETYIELEAGKEVTAEFILKNQTRERYSVNYWLQYKTGKVAELLAAWAKRLPQGPNTPIKLPLLVNGHSFTKCDPWGEHATTWSANPTPNYKFAGKTLLEALIAVDPLFGEQGSWWCFDGDTVEFMTQAFRCTTVEQALLELIEAKERWLRALRTGLAAIRCEAVLKGPVGWPRHNYGLATFLTNRRNVAIFNNGTYHVNITAPTRLGKDGEIEDWPRFLHIHRQGARLFQWLSPFFVAAYGSADVFAHLNGANQAFPAGSQRLAASRYVSVGTYDTRQMPRGKIVTTPTAEMMPPPTWWHEMYARRNVAYEKLESIGYDINFNKFPNHGLEFRIFDWFGEDVLGELLEVLVVMMDRAMTVPKGREVPVPQDSTVWRDVLGRCVWEGADALLTSRELRIYAAILGIPELQHPFYRTVLDAYEIVRKAWKGCRDGPCSSRMFFGLAVGPQKNPEITLMDDIQCVESRPHQIQSLLSPLAIPPPVPVLAQTPESPASPHILLNTTEIVSTPCCLPYFFAKRRTTPSK